VAPSVVFARVVQQTCLCTFACRVLPSGYSHGLLVHLIQLVTRSIVQRGVIMHCPAFHCAWDAFAGACMCRDREHVLFHAPVGIACTACVCPFCHGVACNDAPLSQRSIQASVIAASPTAYHACMNPRAQTAVCLTSTAHLALNGYASMHPELPASSCPSTCAIQ
jgi:hypothetical protein